MVRFRDFEVVVRVDGRDLPEYETENDDSSQTNTVTRYIEAQSGAKFGFHIKYVGGNRLPGPPNIKGVSYHAYVDGCDVRSIFKDTPPFKGKVRECLDVKNNKYYTRDLLFSELNIVEETGDWNDAVRFQALRNQLHQVGTLAVTITRVSSVESGSPSGSISGTHQLPMNDHSNAIPEKALKGDAKSHFVKFGKKKEHSRHPVKCTYYDVRPFLQFNFKYRSRRALEQLHIIPCAPTPPDSDLLGLSRDELMQMVQVQRHQIQTQSTSDRKIKAEASHNRSNGSKRPRNEDEDDDIVAIETRSVRHRGSGPDDRANAEIVDLTED